VDNEGDKIRRLMIDGISPSQRDFMREPQYAPMLQDLFMDPERGAAIGPIPHSLPPPLLEYPDRRMDPRQRMT